MELNDMKGTLEQNTTCYLFQLKHIYTVILYEIWQIESVAMWECKINKKEWLSYLQNYLEYLILYESHVFSCKVCLDSSVSGSTDLNKDTHGFSL